MLYQIAYQIINRLENNCNEYYYYCMRNSNKIIAQNFKTNNWILTECTDVGHTTIY